VNFKEEVFLPSTSDPFVKTTRKWYGGTLKSRIFGIRGDKVKMLAGMTRRSIVQVFVLTHNMFTSALS
jgi:hypothetical protein